jgi:undecaprenyl diphosphate synthase
MVHIGIIPDGNRRWCKKNNLNNEDIFDYYIFKIIEFIKVIKNKKKCSKYLKNINEISFYISSIDNMNRKDNTKMIIYNLIRKINKQFTKEMLKSFLEKHDMYDDFYNKLINFYNLLNINFIGEISKLPEDIQLIINKIKKYNTKNKYTINFAIYYDYYKDIENYNKNDNNEYNRIQSNIDLIIRTGGEYRISGFFPTKTIYSELFILKKYWPDIKYNDFINILKKYNNRDRRFGK